jgi:hypothetical protein
VPGNQVIWSEEAQSTIDRLPDGARAAVERRLGYVRQMPRMYAAAQDGLFPGCRSFWVDPTYRVYYMVAAGGDDIFVRAIVEEAVQGLVEEA